MKKKILITGGGGFIGGHLVKRLLDEGHEVVCADNKPFEYWFQHFDECKNYSLDLKDYESCLKVSEGVGIMIIQPGEYFQSLCNGHKRLGKGWGNFFVCQSVFPCF